MFEKSIINTIPRSFEEEEKGPGTHCACIRKFYGAFSSTIHWVLLLPCGRTCTDKAYRYTKHPKSVKPRDSIFLFDFK